MTKEEKISTLYKMLNLYLDRGSLTSEQEEESGLFIDEIINELTDKL